LKTKECYSGSKKAIELLEMNDGSCEVQVFLDSLDKSDRRKIDVLFEMMGEQGKISNKEKFKKLEGTDGIFEFKSFQIRLLCFLHHSRVIICRGVKKKKDKHDLGDISYAETCRRNFLGENK
jgi:mRNA-degrading endonuclease RelE of RelBE toxin-antitoxin system